MDKQYTKSKWTGLIAASIALAIVVTALSLAVFFLGKENRANKIKVENFYQENLYALSENMNNLENDLAKLMVSTENSESTVLLNDVFHHSQMALFSINALPLDNEDRLATDKFLNQISDWSKSYAKKLQGSFSSDDVAIVQSTVDYNNYKNQMKREFAKHDCCKNIVESDKHDCCKKFDECDKSAFYKAFEEYDKNAFCKEFEECEKKGSGCEKNPANNPQVENYDGSIISVSADMFEDFEGDSDEKYFRGQSISAAKNGTSSYDKQAEELHERVEMLNLKIKKAAENLKRDYSMLKGLKNGLFVGFDLSDKNEEEPSDVPQLIYDGPFSDGQNAKNYKGLEGKEEIDLEKAKQILTERFASLEIKEISSLGEASDPDAFLLTSDTKNGNMFASVAKKGGVILAAICDSPSKQENLNLSEEDAKEKAMEYAKMCGFDGLSPVWISESQGYAVVNLTPIKDNIVFYPDLVKVKICMASGDFEGIETVGYCASHTQRSLSPTISESEAQAVVSSKLQLSGSRLAVIPKDQKELLCYEFTGSYKGLDYFVYIDAASGKQANIMRVINDEQGKMVM